MSEFWRSARIETDVPVGIPVSLVLELARLVNDSELAIRLEECHGRHVKVLAHEFAVVSTQVVRTVRGRATSVTSEAASTGEPLGGPTNRPSFIWDSNVAQNVARDRQRAREWPSRLRCAFVEPKLQNLCGRVAHGSVGSPPAPLR